MCGVTGLLTARNADRVDLSVVAGRMADTLAHRGPDDSGVWLDESAGVALAHRRLSIIDLSPAGAQPMLSPSGRFVIVFNGEIYNYVELRQELEGTSRKWRGHSDTEVLLAGFEAWGVGPTLEKVIGMFAFAAWDRHEHALVLARDPVGEKPMYYGWLGNVFAFGSELKALRAHPEFDADVDRGALALFLRHNYVPAPYSIYRGIHKLLPGTYLTLAAGRREPTITPYWSARLVSEAGTAAPLDLSDEEATSALDTLLRDAVGKQMMADVPLGAFLSGGIDSSTVVALMQAQSSRPVKTFTVGFFEAAYDEARHAASVARHLGTDHTELYVTAEQAQAVIPRLPRMYDEPFADSSQIPTFLIAQLARRHVTVALSGDAGDELFGGYNRYFWATELWRRMRRVPHASRVGAARLITSISPSTWSRVFDVGGAFVPGRYRYANAGDRLHKLADLLAAQRPESIYLQLVSHWSSPESVVIDSVEPATALTDREGWARLPDFERRMMYLDLVTYLPDDILVKVDRAAMSVSLETRVPLLDRRVVRFAWQLPLHQKIRDGHGKWLLRQVLHRYVPRSLMERPKMGFGVPIDAWLRGPLRDWAEALLDEGRLTSEGYLRPASIRTKWSEHLSGRRNWAYGLWNVLMFQAWLEQSRTGTRPVLASS
jgi:asparagine synthase (glutamine-hydrolysing)